MTSYWGANGGQEGCHFDIASQVAFLKVLHPILKASGLNTVISASEETDAAQSVRDFEGYQAAGMSDNGTHTPTRPPHRHAAKSARSARNRASVYG